MINNYDNGFHYVSNFIHQNFQFLSTSLKYVQLY